MNLPLVRKIGLSFLISALCVLVFRTGKVHVPRSEQFSLSRFSRLADPIDTKSCTIWQIFFNASEITENVQNAMQTWTQLNPTNTYELVRKDRAAEFVHHHLKDRPDILEIFDRVPSNILRADLLRYVILAVEGGVYSDADTIAKKPVAQWIPEEFRGKARLVIGLEYDQGTDMRFGGFHNSMSLCQWTIAAARGHKALWRVVDDAAWAIIKLADTKMVSLDNLYPAEREVLETTGPAIWTSAIFKHLRSRGHYLTFADLSRMKAPRMIDDILFLPINSFGSGQRHSESGEKGVPDALAEHMFTHAWVHDWSWQFEPTNS